MVYLPYSDLLYIDLISFEIESIKQRIESGIGPQSIEEGKKYELVLANNIFCHKKNLWIVNCLKIEHTLRHLWSLDFLTQQVGEVVL